MLELDWSLHYLERLAKTTIAGMGIPGMAIALTNREQRLWSGAYGVANVDSREPVTPETIFEIGSLGKPFTSLILMQLRDRGQLDLSAPVSDYLPWFSVRSEYGPITVHHLLTHMGGIVRGTDIAPYGFYEAWALKNRQTASAPGATFTYSNLGYKTLGFLAERLTGESLRELIQDRVFSPLGMNDSIPATTQEGRLCTATGHTGQFDDRPEHISHRVVPASWAEYATGDGAQASTVGDMCKYLRMLLNSGVGPTGRIVSDESFSLMVHRHEWTGGDFYGYGLATYDVNRKAYLGHGGGNSGFRSALVIDMEAGLGVVLLANRMGETDPLVEVAQRGLTAARAEVRSEGRISLPVLVDPRVVPNAAEYAGTYTSGPKSFVMRADGNHLQIEQQGQSVAVECRALDTFWVGLPGFELALLGFGRDAGGVVEAFHGGHWYTNERYQGDTTFDVPAEWTTYCGHYRARNPELSNFRVVIRKDGLVMLNPWGNMEPLIQAGEHTFRIGADPLSPETLGFSSFLEGEALRADFSGCPYYRTFTP